MVKRVEKVNEASSLNNHRPSILLLGAMPNVEHVHVPGVDLVEHQIGAHDSQFPHVVAQGAAPVGMLGQALDDPDQARRETLRRERSELADIGANAGEVSDGSWRPN